ncbi:MAG TPA: hypothetical protein VGN48_16750 [Pedococcus sp.]|jgi:hypothetical protein|nr:hypothetical protein [Pedococcus sp.]
MPTPATVALLWDLDNVTAGVAKDAALADQIVSRCYGSSLLYAAGHRATYRSHQPRLAAHDIVLLSGGHRPQGADRRLLQQGSVLARRGVRTFIVASNDRAFAALPAWCAVIVLTLTPNSVSAQLQRRAMEVVTLDHPGSEEPA